MITNLPDKKPFIGTKTIIKNIRNGNVKSVVVARNCPEVLVKKIQESGKIKIDRFQGDEKDLGTKIGRPFPVAAVGYD